VQSDPPFAAPRMGHPDFAGSENDVYRGTIHSARQALAIACVPAPPVAIAAHAVL